MRHALAGLALLAGLAPGFAPSPASGEARREQRLHCSRADRERGHYQYASFDVPAGTTRLAISYRYDKAGGTNVVDLGLFEPGSLDRGSPAFRGWSGGARTEVTIRRGEATPGYWPGPLPVGEWHVALGLHKIAPAGVDVTVTTTTSSEPDLAPTPTLAPRPTGPLRTGPGWYSGALHLHTVHSDGRHTAAEVCRRAREAGLDFVAITDHNNTTHQLEAVEEPELLRIVGEEVTTPGGHATAWGLGGWRRDLDFRIAPGDASIEAIVRDATDRGAIVAISHPKAECPGCAWDLAVPDGVLGIETSAATARERAAAIAMWDAFLRRGRRMVAIGSSDWHSPDHPIAAASVRVWASELSERAILDGIRAGRVVVMAEGRLPPPVLVARAGGAEAHIGDTIVVDRGRPLAIEVTTPEAMAGARVELVWDGVAGESRTAVAGHRARFARAVSADGHVRAQVSTAEGDPLALTNPLFVKASP